MLGYLLGMVEGCFDSPDMESGAPCDHAGDRIEIWGMISVPKTS